MAAKGYCAASDVAAYLGLTFTAAQTTQATALLPAIEEYIDTRAGRAWKMASATVTNERHELPVAPVDGGDLKLYLLNPPINAITSLIVKTSFDADETMLTATTEYVLHDATSGLVYVDRTYAGYLLRATYTQTTTVPEAIKLAAIQIVAATLAPTINPGTEGIRSYRLPDLEVVYAGTEGKKLNVPDFAKDLIDQNAWVSL